MHSPASAKGQARWALQRVAIENLEPQVESGRFPIKRTVGEKVVVTADVVADGHEVLRAELLYRAESAREWTHARMELAGNDRWQGRFVVTSLEPFRYTVQAWIDAYLGWRRAIEKKFEAAQDISVDILAGAELARAAAARARGSGAPEEDAERLMKLAADLTEASKTDGGAAMETARSPELAELMARYPDRQAATMYDKELRVDADREKARFSTWYEMFPRSCTTNPQRQGTFRDCIERLDAVAKMGFDVLYFPPIHPIGRTNRKGRNNTPNSGPADPGSPWAIGAREGGHKAIDPHLGTLEDFRELCSEAHRRGIEIALDLAFQATPDHPYAKEHKNWFRIRPDGSVQYAENPPKKYEDIYPFDFESEDAAALCDELKSVVLYWVEQGVRIFRADNPHTKPFAFWEWLIAEVRTRHPEVIFLAEAFTRPKVMYRLAKSGFTQSYTYFTWKNSKQELTDYFEEITQTPIRDYFRANLWPNTPDILSEYLQFGGRPAFIARLVLAATLGANYGIYGPAFELMENQALRPGSEEYLDSEKYQIRAWDIDRADSLRGLIGQVNAIRRSSPALQSDEGLRFHSVDNEQLIAYTKATEDLSDIVLVAVNLDPHYIQRGWVEVPLEEFHLDAVQTFQVHDLLSGARYLWHGSRNYIELDPAKIPAHIFKLRRRVRTERDFDYFL